MASQSPYDLILTDIKMPGISGDEVLGQVKSQNKYSIPVIGMSGTPWLLEQSNFDAVIAKDALQNNLSFNRGGVNHVTMKTNKAVLKIKFYKQIQVTDSRKSRPSLKAGTENQRVSWGDSLVAIT